MSTSLYRFLYHCALPIRLYRDVQHLEWQEKIKQIHAAKHAASPPPSPAPAQLPNILKKKGKKAKTTG